jgi:hypothetical protein
MRTSCARDPFYADTGLMPVWMHLFQIQASMHLLQMPVWIGK